MNPFAPAPGDDPVAAERALAGRDQHDLRLVAPALAVWATALILIGQHAITSYVTAGLTGSAALIALARPVRWRRTSRPRPPWAGPFAAAVLACAAAAALSTGLRLSAVESGPVRELARAGVPTRFEAVVTGDPRLRRAQGRPLVIVNARAETVRWHGEQIRVRVPVLLLASEPAWAGLVTGRRVRFTGRPALPRHAEPLAAVVLVRGPPTVIGEPSLPLRVAATVRARLRQATDDLPAAQRGVLPGMVLGDTSRLDPELAEDFRVAGLSHIMVVSGSNLAIITSAVLVLTRRGGLGRRRAPPLAATAVVAFVIVARPDPSVLRAAVMGMIGLLALFSGRERQGLPALGAAVIGLVLVDPALSRSYGFALSVLATAGLLLLAPGWRDRLCRWLPRPIAEVLAVTAAAQVGCTPVLVMLSGEISLVAIAANLFAAPMIVPATLLGALAATIAPFALAPARLLLWPAGLAVGWIIGVARIAADIPHATVHWPAGFVGALLLVAAATPAVLVVRRRRLRRIGAAALAGVFVAVVGLRLLSPGWPPRGWLFTACDVGQGDALVLAVAPGQAVVVDAGPEPGTVDRCLDDLGIRAVPMLVLTHPHADHIDGAPGVRDGRPIGTVLTSPLSEEPEPKSLAGLAAAAGGAGARWAVGSLTLSVLGPVADGPHVSRDDPGTEVNNASIVLVARWPGLTALLSGDLETEAQRSLAASVPQVDVLKVPHHGSARQDPAFLQASQARIALVSVGAGNDYGHPAPVTESLLRRYAMQVYRTDHHGDIAIVPTDSGINVVPRRS